jgi:hypothetical protein
MSSTLVEEHKSSESNVIEIELKRGIINYS